jgi:hypothetical protein
MIFFAHKPVGQWHLVKEIININGVGVEHANGHVTRCLFEIEIKSIF